MEPDACLFCQHLSGEHRILFETKNFWVRYDNFPVSPGHVEIVSQRHIPDIFALNAEEWTELPFVLARTKKFLDATLTPDGYNIGINGGQAAGQTVMHLHIHYFPRFTGDVPNPRGGIRNFKPALKQY